VDEINIPERPTSRQKSRKKIQRKKKVFDRKLWRGVIGTGHTPKMATVT